MPRDLELQWVPVTADVQVLLNFVGVLNLELSPFTLISTGGKNIHKLLGPPSREKLGTFEHDAEVLADSSTIDLDFLDGT